MYGVLSSFLAEGGTSTTIADVKTSLSTGLTSAGADMMDVISTVVPIAIGVVGAILVVKLGMKIFKSLSNRS